MTIDWTINLSGLLSAIVLLFGFVSTSIGYYYASKYKIKEISGEVATLGQVITDKVTTLGGRVINVENKLDRFNETLIELARVSERLGNLDRRIDQLQKSADEWRAWARPRLDNNGNGNSPR